MIPSPNLDDRTYEDIVEEAIRLIPQYCPEWTNFNPSDPGITLIHLFAWMAEMIIYRLNRVPEKNYLAFLDLMGVQRQAPQPAHTVLHFDLSDKTDSLLVKTGTQVSTRPTGDRKATSFETSKDVLLLNNRINRAISQYHEQYADVTPYIAGRAPFEVFEGVSSVDRYVYLGDQRLENFSEAAILTLTFDRPNPGERSLPKMLEWEYFNGERWRQLSEATVDVISDSIAFIGPNNLEKTTVHGTETYWIRGRLVEVPVSADGGGYLETEIDRIFGRIEVLGDGVEPHLAYFNPQGEAYLLLDQDRNFKLLGDEPTVDNFLYLASDEVLSQPNTRIHLDIMLSDPSIVDTPMASPELLLEWQYHDGKRWRPLARTGPGHNPTKGKSKARENPHNFQDGTAAFTKNGTIGFDRPARLCPCAVNGKKHYWLRVQVLKGGYGEKGSYELIDERWVYKDERPLRPPSLKSLSLKFTEQNTAFEKALTYNDFQYEDVTSLAATEYKPYQAFQPVPEENPTLYLGFENPFPNEQVQLYFNMVDASALDGGPARTKVFVGDELETFAEQSVVWEYWNGKEWALLLPRDGTENFTVAGFLEFVGPKIQRKTKRYGDNLYWLRARLEMGGYDEPPVCDRIMLNAVAAAHHTTYPETSLGSSQGTPNQSFYFNRGPVLPGEQIAIIEHERPSESELEQFVAEHGETAFSKTADGKYLLLWSPVESLYESGPKARHYVKDITTGEIRFGDGVHGMIPPKGERNIRALRYQVGGGSHGNVPAGSISVLKTTLSYVNAVTNPFAAMGGADLEDVEEIKLRGPSLLKSRGRAVTREDYEALAHQASNGVARASCIPCYRGEGQVAVVVVPKVSERFESESAKPVPSTELLRRVSRYLTERKLLTTRLHVLKPRYRELSVRVEITRRPSGAADRIKREIDGRLRDFLHPLRGGKQKRGWDFGRNVFKVDLYHVVEDVDGVEFVSRVSIHDEEKKVDVEQIRIADDELPFLVNVDITERANEQIV